MSKHNLWRMMKSDVMMIIDEIETSKEQTMKPCAGCNGDDE